MDPRNGTLHGGAVPLFAAGIDRGIEMAKLAFGIDLGNLSRGGGHDDPDTPIVEDPGVPILDAGHGGDGPDRDSDEQGQLDDDAVRVHERSSGERGRPSDLELKDQIKWVEWNPDLLARAAQHINEERKKYFTDSPIDPAQLMQELHIASEQILQLGEGGIIVAYPVFPGLSAEVRCHIWDELWQGRPEILAAANRLFFKTWSLRRLGMTLPGRAVEEIELALETGWQEEGRLRQTLVYTDGVDDSVLLGLLPEEA